MISKIQTCKIAEFKEVLGMSYVVNLDQTLTLTQAEINRKTEVNLSPRKFDGFGGFFLNTA